MIECSASAPGKLVLCGEYVVLDGAPAIAAAVDRRASVTVEAAAGNCHSATFPGYSSQQLTFSVSDNGRPRWNEAAPDLSLFEAVWEECAAAVDHSLRLTVDTSAFLHPTEGLKLGLGSSAALTVALSAALGRGDVNLDQMIRMHSLYQGGRGSGVDIAVSCNGGVVEFRTGEPAQARKLRWPPGLAFAVMWSGVASSTRQKIERFAAAKPGARSRQLLAESSASIADIWDQGSAARVIAGFVKYVQHLREFDAEHDLGIFDAGHAELAAIAPDYGLVYKPCGAGGGDVGVVLGDDPGQIDAFVDAAGAGNSRRLEAGLDPNGLRVNI